MPIVSVFERELARLRHIMPPQQKRFLDDMEKRLVALFDALNHDEIPPPIASQLLRIVKGNFVVAINVV
jgi:protein transport protein SEC31